jgi:hypothetical protein
METTSDILNELAALSPLIAALDKVNVYTVPQGYFDSVCPTVLACLPENLVLPPITADGKNPAVPEGYFNQLASSILDKIKADQTAKEEIAGLSPLLSGLQQKQVFELPMGYFTQLSDDIIDSIQNASSSDELKKISPVLHGIQKINLFEVPTGYFEGLSNSILQKAKTSSAARAMGSPVRTLFFRYAAAAVITGIIALGAFQYLGQPTPTSTSNNTLAVLDESVEKGKTMNDSQFKEALEKLSPADIAKYLENEGDMADVAVLRNNIDENKLPSQDDYLLDETTLDNFIKEMNTTQTNN